MPEEAASESAAEAKPSGGLLGGIKGWIIVIGITLLQAGFWIFLMIYREPGAPPDPVAQVKPFLEDPAILNSKVEFRNFYASLSGPGGDQRPLQFDAVLELHYLPEEKQANATRPTVAQIENFRIVVTQLESKIRDHMNTFLVSQSFNNLNNEKGPELVKTEIKRFVNNELLRYDFEKMSIPADISRRRVTAVLLPTWSLM